MKIRIKPQKNTKNLKKPKTFYYLHILGYKKYKLFDVTRFISVLPASQDDLIALIKSLFSGRLFYIKF